MALLLGFNSIELGQSYDLHFRILSNHDRMDPTLRRTIPFVVLRSFALASWSWSCGFALVALTGWKNQVSAILFCLALVIGELWSARNYPGLTRSGFAFSLLLDVILVLIPVMWGIRAARGRVGRHPVLAIIWGTAFMAVLALQFWFSWPWPLGWVTPSAPLLERWPFFYAVAALYRPLSRAIALSH